jgi:hypothetical protein
MVTHNERDYARKVPLDELLPQEGSTREKRLGRFHQRN